MVCKDLASIHWIHIELLHVVCKAAKSSFPDFSCASSEGVCNCGNDFWCHHVRPDAESKTLSWEVCLFVYLGTLQMSPGFLETQLRIYYRVYCSACWTGAWDRGRPDGRVPLLVSFVCSFVATVVGIVFALQGAHQEEAFSCAALLRRAAGKWKQGGLCQVKAGVI